MCRQTINTKKIFNIDRICTGDERTHFGFGFAPIVSGAPCRFCHGYQL